MTNSPLASLLLDAGRKGNPIRGAKVRAMISAPFIGSPLDESVTVPEIEHCAWEFPLPCAKT
jgi:hypothetical protein